MSYLLSFYRVISEMQTGRVRVVRWQKIMGCHITSWSTVFGRASIWHSFCALVRALYYHRSENKLNRTTISCRISCVGHTRTYAHVLSVSVPHTHTHRNLQDVFLCRCRSTPTGPTTTWPSPAVSASSRTWARTSPMESCWHRSSRS